MNFVSVRNVGPGSRLKVVSNDPDTLVEVSETPLQVPSILEWATVPGCGAVDLFCGTVRDHSDGRTGITRLDYEAHPTEAEARMWRIVDVARRRWPAIDRIALVHRVGSLAVGDVAVVVAVSSPHRPEAFAATRWCIDALKATVPIWKYEVWNGGEGWGTCAHELEEIGDWDRDWERAEATGVS